MTPLTSTTQQFIPTQPSLVATALPNTQALRPANNAVAPSVSNAQVANDRNPNGAAPQSAAPSATPAPAAQQVLNVPIPANFSTSSASLNASAIFAAQTLAQDSGALETLFANYDALVRASEVKYKPSNATLPTPDAGNLFAKLLNEEKSAGTKINPALLQQATKEPSAPASTLAANSNQRTVEKPVVNGKDTTKPTTARGESLLAATAYRATSARNSSELDSETIEKISG